MRAGRTGSPVLLHDDAALRFIPDAITLSENSKAWPATALRMAEIDVVVLLMERPYTPTSLQGTFFIAATSLNIPVIDKVFRHGPSAQPL